MPAGAQRQVMKALHATDGRDGVPSLPRKSASSRNTAILAGRITEFDEMFGGIVEATFRFHRAPTVQEHFSHLAVGAGQPFFVP